MILQLPKVCSPIPKRHTFSIRLVAIIVCLNFWTFPFYAQQTGIDDKIVIDAVTITGKVTEVTGEPLPGVTIFLENSPYGTASDIDGNFSLQIPTGGTLGTNILFGMIGMKAKTIPYTGQETINVVLEEDMHALEDVVVTGMATIKRGDMVGSYQKVKMDDINQPNYTTVDQMLQGQVAGMIVTNTGHRAGSPTNITIRGNATLIGNKEPLWVIDGIPQAESFEFAPQSNIFGEGNGTDLNQYIGSQIAWLNPNDIESVTVLKDASATAMYGSRAANGVIVIQTKKPEYGRFSVNFQSNITINQRPNYGNYYLMNSQERVRFSQEAFAAGAYYHREPLAQLNTYEGAYSMFKSGELSRQDFLDQYSRMETVNTDWFDLLMRNAVTQNYTVTLGGSSNNLSVNSSLGYSKQQGLEVGNETERFTARVAATYTFSPTVKVDMAVWGAKAVTNGFAAGVNPQSYAVNTSRAIPAMDEDGELVYYRTRESYRPNGDVEKYGLNYNILNERDNSGSVINSQTAAANLTLVWDILPNLRYELMGGYNSQIRDSEAYAGEKTQYIARNYRGYDYRTADPGSDDYLASVLPFGGELLTLNANQETYNLKNSLIYRQTFKDVHRISGTILWDVQSTHTRSKQNTVWGYDKERGETIAPPRLPEEIIPANGGTTGLFTSGYGVYTNLYQGNRWLSLRSTYNVMSIAALFTYNYDERYAINLNFRNDASNRFGQDINHRFDPTYSLGVAWHLANEEFLRPVEWIDQLTFKTTFGIQGNSMSGISPDLIFKKSGMSTVYNSYLSEISQLANPLLGWERTKSWNFGTDISLFDGRVTMALEGYSRLTNAMNTTKLSIELGDKFATPVKGNHIRNTGIESLINVVALNQKDWRLNLSFNFSKNWNKVTKIADIQNQSIYTSNYIDGQKLVLVEKDYAYGAFWAYSFAGLDPETGYPTFNNMDLEDADYTDMLVYAGNTLPSISGGLTASLSYKRFTLSGVFTGVTGGKTFLPNPYSSFYSGYMPEATINFSRELVDRWKQSGDKSNIPAVFTSSGDYYTIVNPVDGKTENIYSMWAQSDARIVSNGFLKCRTISLAWYDSSEFWQKAGIRNIRISASMNNIFTIADKKWKGMDPETGGTYKDPRSYTIGLALGF